MVEGIQCSARLYWKIHNRWTFLRWKYPLWWSFPLVFRTFLLEKITLNCMCFITALFCHPTFGCLALLPFITETFLFFIFIFCIFFYPISSLKMASISNHHFHYYLHRHHLSFSAMSKSWLDKTRYAMRCNAIPCIKRKKRLCKQQSLSVSPFLWPL